MLTYALAVLAACSNAVSSVLQRKANKRVPQSEDLSLRQIWTLLHQPVWFGGILAITAGSTFGLTAALMKAMTRTLAEGLGHLFTDWPIYAMVAAGVLGMFLTQAALNAGQLIAAQPGLTLSDPLISVLWGVLVFHEQVRQGWFILGEVLSAGVIVAGVVMLAHSPLLADDAGAKPERSQEEPATVR